MTVGASRTPPHDLVPDGVEHARGLQTAHAAPSLALGKCLGLGLGARRVAARKTNYPAVSSGVPGDRHCALRGEREEISPCRREIAVW